MENIKTVEDMENYEMSLDPYLEKRKTFMEKLNKMTPEKKDKYLNKLNKHRDESQRMSMRNFLYSVGYDENFIDDNT